MTLRWLKRILVYSAAFTGGYNLYFWSWNANINFGQKIERTVLEKDSNCSYIYISDGSGNNFDESFESSSIFWRKHNLPIYWKLLMLGRSKDHKVRLKAVEALSKLTSLEKWQYIVIAQACDINTSIGLARSYNTNQYFFLPPPFKDLDEGNLQTELYHMLTSLTFSNKDICIQNLIKQVIKSAKLLLKSGYQMDLEVGDASVLYHSQQKQKVLFLYDKLCLQAILDCSIKSSLKTIMMEKGILKLLLKILQSHKEDIEIHSLIAQIVANLATEENFRNSLYMTGWIGILSEWKNSSYINVNLPAAKALANLDKDDISHPIYEDGVYILNPLCRLSQRDISADVIFIHGLLGATFWTWRQSDSQKTKKESVIKKEDSNSDSDSGYSTCWPKDWLATDIPSLRIISVDYKSCISNWGSYCPEMTEKDSIKMKAKELMDKLLLSNVGEKPIIWIAHSMGGLIVKQILTEAFESEEKNIQSLLKKTIGMVFYSVPHKGSEIATKINSASLILQLSSDIEELKKDSPRLMTLHEKFKEIISLYSIPILSFGETRKSRWGLNTSILVPFDSANPGIGKFYTLPVDHLNTCKPVSSKSPEYLKVLNFLKKNLSRININEAYFLQKADNIFEISKIMCLIP